MTKESFNAILKEFGKAFLISIFLWILALGFWFSLLYLLKPDIILKSQSMANCNFNQTTANQDFNGHVLQHGTDRAFQFVSNTNFTENVFESP